MEPMEDEESEECAQQRIMQQFWGDMRNSIGNGSHLTSFAQRANFQPEINQLINSEVTNLTELYSTDIERVAPRRPTLYRGYSGRSSSSRGVLRGARGGGVQSLRSLVVRSIGKHHAFFRRKRSPFSPLPRPMLDLLISELPSTFRTPGYVDMLVTPRTRRLELYLQARRNNAELRRKYQDIAELWVRVRDQTLPGWSTADLDNVCSNVLDKCRDTLQSMHISGIQVPPNACGPRLNSLLQQLTGLTEFSLDSFDDAMADTMIESVVRNNPNLTHVTLTWCETVTAAGLAVLVEHCPRLKHLNLWGTSSFKTPDLVAALQGLNELETLRHELRAAAMVELARKGRANLTPRSLTGDIDMREHLTARSMTRLLELFPKCRVLLLDPTKSGMGPPGELEALQNCPSTRLDALSIKFYGLHNIPNAWLTSVRNLGPALTCLCLKNERYALTVDMGLLGEYCPLLEVLCLAGYLVSTVQETATLEEEEPDQEHGTRQQVDKPFSRLTELHLLNQREFSVLQPYHSGTVENAGRLPNQVTRRLLSGARLSSVKLHFVAVSEAVVGVLIKEAREQNRGVFSALTSLWLHGAVMSAQSVTGIASVAPQLSELRWQDYYPQQEHVYCEITSGFVQRNLPHVTFSRALPWRRD